MVTYDLQGTERDRREPPQVIAGQDIAALHADGRSVAVYSAGSHTMKIYDLTSDAVVASVRVRFPGGRTPVMLDWTGTRQITAHVTYGDDGGKQVMRIFQVDSETGAFRVRDSYKIHRGFVYAACGG